MRRKFAGVVATLVLVGVFLLPGCSGPQTVPTVDGVKITAAMVETLDATYKAGVADGVLTINDLVVPVVNATKAGMVAGNVDPKAVAYYDMAIGFLKSGLMVSDYGNYVLSDNADDVFRITSVCVETFLAELNVVFADLQVTVLEWVNVAAVVINVALHESGKWDIPVKGTPGATWGTAFIGARDAATALLVGFSWDDVVTCKSE